MAIYYEAVHKSTDPAGTYYICAYGTPSLNNPTYISLANVGEISYGGRVIEHPETDDNCLGLILGRGIGTSASDIIDLSVEASSYDTYRKPTLYINGISSSDPNASVKPIYYHYNCFSNSSHKIWGNISISVNYIADINLLPWSATALSLQFAEPQSSGETYYHNCITSLNSPYAFCMAIVDAIPINRKSYLDALTINSVDPRLTSLRLPNDISCYQWFRMSQCGQNITTISGGNNWSLSSSSQIVDPYYPESIWQQFPNLENIDQDSLCGWSGPEDLMIPSTISWIGDGALTRWKNLHYVRIQDGNARYKTVKDPDAILGGGIWDLESKILKIALYPSVFLDPWLVAESDITIGRYCFANSSSYTWGNVTLPNTVSQIDEGAFSGIRKTIRMTLPNRLFRIDVGLFKESYLSAINIPASVRDICDSAFEGTILYDIEIPTSVTSIGANIFKNCSIENIAIPFIGCERPDLNNLSKDYEPLGYLFGDGDIGVKWVYQYRYDGDSRSFQRLRYGIPESLLYLKITDSEHLQPNLLLADLTVIPNPLPYGKSLDDYRIYLDTLSISSKTKIFWDHLYLISNQDIGPFSTSHIKYLDYDGSLDDYYKLQITRFGAAPLFKDNFDQLHNQVEHFRIGTSSSNQIDVTNFTYDLVLDDSLDQEYYIFGSKFYNWHVNSLSMTKESCNSIIAKLLTSSSNFCFYEIKIRGFLVVPIDIFSDESAVAKMGSMAYRINIWRKEDSIIPSSFISIVWDDDMSEYGYKTIYIDRNVGRKYLIWGSSEPSSNPIISDLYFNGTLTEFIEELSENSLFSFRYAKYIWVHPESTSTSWVKITPTTQLTSPISALPQYALMYSPIEIISLPNILTIGDYAFYNCSNLKQITLGSNLSSIGVNAFKNATALENIYYDNSLAHYMTQIILSGQYSSPTCNGKSLLWIKESSSSPYNSVYTITIDNRISKDNPIKKYIFYNYLGDGLSSGVIIDIINDEYEGADSGLSIVQQNAFSYCDCRVLFSPISWLYPMFSSACGNLSRTRLSRLLLKSSTTKTLSGNESYITNLSNILQEIRFPSNLTSIPEHLLQGFTQLASITTPFIGADPNDFGDRDLSWLFGSDAATISNNITTLKFSAPSVTGFLSGNIFKKMSNLQTLVLPGNVKNIRKNWFENCKNLITWSNGKTLAQNGGYLPAVLTANDSVDDLGIAYYLVDAAKMLKSRYTVSANCKIIAGDAFKNLRTVNRIYLPSSLIAIGEHAFEGCISLTSINIPKNVTWIGPYAFQGCSALQALFVDKFNTTYTSGDNFTNAVIELQNNKAVICSNTSKINPSILEVGSSAFDSCGSLASLRVTTPNLTKLESKALRDCIRLTEIYFSGTKLEWSSIIKDEDWLFESKSIIIHCSDGDLEINP